MSHDLEETSSRDGVLASSGLNRLRWKLVYFRLCPIQQPFPYLLARLQHSTISGHDLVALDKMSEALLCEIKCRRHIDKDPVSEILKSLAYCQRLEKA
jgi:hypothetical protein